MKPNAVLRDLFYGKYIPYENIFPKDPAFIALNQSIRGEKAYFKGVLTEADYIRLEKLETLYTESSDIQNVEVFSCGFRLAVKLMAEVFDADSQVSEIVRLLNIGKQIN